MRRHHTLFVFILWLLAACEESIDRTIPAHEADLLVVEAVLTNDNINHQIKLTRPHQTVNGEGEPVTGAIVRVVEGSNLIFTATESPAGSGIYFTQQMRAVFGRTYTLYIQYNGREYFAQDRSVPVDALPPLRYQKASTTESLYRLLQEDTGNGPNYITHAISWKQTAYCEVGQECEGLLVHYNLKNIDVNSVLFKPEKTDFVFPVNSIVIRRKFAVSDRYQAFLRSMLSETEWRGSVFDVERGNATTNLSSGAVGFFAVTTVVSDTTVIN